MQGGITDEEFAASLEMPLEEWLELRKWADPFCPTNKIAAELVFEGAAARVFSHWKNQSKALHEARKAAEGYRQMKILNI